MVFLIEIIRCHNYVESRYQIGYQYIFDVITKILYDKVDVNVKLSVKRIR